MIYAGLKLCVNLSLRFPFHDDILQASISVFVGVRLYRLAHWRRLLIRTESSWKACKILRKKSYLNSSFPCFFKYIRLPFRFCHFLPGISALEWKFHTKAMALYFLCHMISVSYCSIVTAGWFSLQNFGAVEAVEVEHHEKNQKIFAKLECNYKDCDPSAVIPDFASLV